jgi:hypothetical protein
MAIIHDSIPTTGSEIDFSVLSLVGKFVRNEKCCH